MELLHISYQTKNKNQKYLLLLYLGQRGDKICGIITTSIGELEKQTIISNKDRLSNLPLDRQLAWIKHNCPAAYKSGYREIYNNNITIINRHSMY